MHAERVSRLNNNLTGSSDTNQLLRHINITSAIAMTCSLKGTFNVVSLIIKMYCRK